MVRAATAQAVMASISTPVLPSHRTIDRTSIEPASWSMSKVMSTDVSKIVCVRGMSEGVCFAARTPATFAVVNTSPFGRALSTSLERVAGVIRTVAEATASRWVARLEPTSTMEMPPVSSRCEKSLLLMSLLRLQQIIRGIDVHQRLAGMPRAQVRFCDDLRAGLVDQAAQVVTSGSNPLLDAIDQCRRVAG